MASPPPLPVADDGSIGKRARIVGLVILLLLVTCALAIALLLERDSSTKVDKAAAGETLNSANKDKTTNNSDGVPGVKTAISTRGPSSKLSAASTEVAATDGRIELEASTAIAPTSGNVAESDAVVNSSLHEDTSANPFFTLDQSPSAHVRDQRAIGAGDTASAEFFGVEAKGKRFVYVVDVSSSMTGAKFDKARNELLDSIDALGRDQRFFVAFFNEGPFYQPIDRLVLARPNNKKQIKAWIMRALPSGGTSPSEAVAYAISLRPDSIFLLSDGEFDQSEVKNIRSENSRFHVTIHTIGFQTDAQTLKVIAEENQGKYRYVP